MKISEFILQDDAAMKAAVLHEGVLIAKRKENDRLIFLFQMEDYYVEACFNMKNKSAVEYRAFNNMVSLSPYLEAIAIDDLFA